MFGKKKMQKEIDDLQSRLRVIETFTVPYASETKRALYLMNVPSSGRGDVVTRLSSLETSVRELSSVRLTTYEEHNKLWHLVNNLAELLGYKRNTHTSDSVCLAGSVQASAATRLLSDLRNPTEGTLALEQDGVRLSLSLGTQSRLSGALDMLARTSGGTYVGAGLVVDRLDDSSYNSTSSSDT